MSHSSLDNLAASLSLPAAPANLTGPVKAWSEPVAVLTCQKGEPSRNPVFSNDRLGRRSRQAAYPRAAIETVSVETSPVSTAAIHLENEFLRFLILPDAGARIFLGIDKTDGREFLYRPAAIEPASQGDMEPDFPGGLRIQWPSDPAPSPMQVFATSIEESADGARVVWCSATDLETGLRGSHGFCLYPGRAYLEVRSRLVNRTPMTQTFNWSATASVAAAESGRGLASFPASETSPEGFFGVYDSFRACGLVQIAERYISAGQRLSLHTEFADMRTGIYSGLPPGATRIAPFETKSFTQLWYPYSRIGALDKANPDGALRLTVAETVTVGVTTTRPFPGCSVLLETEGTVLSRWSQDLLPGQPLLEETTLPAGIESSAITLKVVTSTGRELISFSPSTSVDGGEASAPAHRKQIAAGELPPPRKARSVEELFLLGLQASKEIQPVFRAEEYWQEALRLHPGHVGANNAVGLSQLHRGEFGEAEAHFRTATENLVSGHTGALDGEPYYNLGLALRFQERDEEAYAAFHQASWSFAWRAPALQAAAELDARRNNFGVVPKYLYEALRLNADNNHARSLAVVLFRRFGRATEAEHLVRESLLLDPLDPWACHLAGRPLPGNNQTRLDLAFDYARAGLYQPAIEILTAADTFVNDGSLPMVHYTLASFYMRVGDLMAAQREYIAAGQSQPDYCFPHRLDEMMVLARAIALQPEDARAQYYLGCLLYYYGLPLQALEIWESSAKLDESFPTVWRNLAIGYYNVAGDNEKALDCFDRAFNANRFDAQVFSERDQLWKRLGVPPHLRLREMEEHRALVEEREDLILELASLYNTAGQAENALSLFSSGQLRRWEHDVHGVDQYVRTFVKLGRQALLNNDTERARDLFLLPLSTLTVSAENHRGHAKAAELQFWLGETLDGAGHQAAAQAYWRKAASLYSGSEPRPAFDENTFFAALSFGRLGERAQSRRLLRELWFSGRRITREKEDAMPASTASGEAISVLKEDHAKSRRIHGLLLQSQARVGLGQYKLAGRLLEQLLKLDPNNGRALDLIIDLELAAPR